MTLRLEAQRTRSMLDRLDRVERVAETLPADDPRRAELLSTVQEALAEAEPIRPIVAASLLHFTEKTVREWAREGVLQVRQGPRLLLDPSRLHEVARLVDDLREAGRVRGLLDEVHRQLTDRALMDREDLVASLEQMRRGQGQVVRPRKASA